MGGVEGGEGGTTELKLRRQTRNLFGGKGGLEDLFGDRKIWQIIRYIYTFFWQLDLSRNFEGCSKQSGAHNAGLAVQTARWEKDWNSADCKMNKKTTNIYFPVLVILIFLVFVADQKSAMVNLPGKKKREVRKKRVYFYGDWLCLL